jgi:type I site-specific restriction-modification system R (restriction) subunit
MGKEGKIEKHPSQEEEDLEIKTPEELEEAKKEAGTSTHKEVLKRYGETRKKEKEIKGELTKYDWLRDAEEAEELIKTSLEEKGELEKYETDALKKAEEEGKTSDSLYELDQVELCEKQFKNCDYFLDLLKQAGREDLIEGYLRHSMGKAWLVANYAKVALRKLQK